MVNDRIWTLLSRKLSGEASNTELEELDKLCIQFPNAEQRIKNITGWWMTPPDTDVDFMEATYLQHLERMKLQDVHIQHDDNYLNKSGDLMQSQKKTSKNLKRFFIGSAMLAVLITVAMLVFNKKTAAKLNGKTYSEVKTPHGNRSKILLPDGSGVWLNSDSKITYPKVFDKESREVYLDGEAFFDVVKNPNSPFIINTDKIQIKVLGTRFNVKAYKNDRTTETSLIKGSVEVFLVHDPKKKFLLKPNEKLVLQNSLKFAQAVKQSATTTVSTAMVTMQPLTYMKGSGADVETSWTRNILSFEDEEFVEVAHKLERWYNVQIIFKSKKWEQQYLSGSFEMENLEQALQALSFTTGFKYISDNGQVIIY